MNLVWIVLAGISIVAAAMFLWLDNPETAFVVATLGVVAWFINYRTKLKRTVATAAQAENSEGGEPEDSDEN